MLVAPDKQKKAQEELDQVLQGRLPDFDDQPALPYITATVKEVIRYEFWFLNSYTYLKVG